MNQKERLLKEERTKKSLLLSYISYSEPMAKIRFTEEIIKYVNKNGLDIIKETSSANSIEEIKENIKKKLKNSNKLLKSFYKFKKIKKEKILSNDFMVDMIFYNIISGNYEKFKKINIEKELEKINKRRVEILFNNNPREETIFNAALNMHYNIKEINKADLIGNKDINNLELPYKDKHLQTIYISLKDGLLTIKDNDLKEIAFVYMGFLQEDNSRLLSINFRGTDKNAKSMIKYVSDDYLNMKNHYDKINLGVQYVLSLLKPQYDSVLLSGHSLGGAMANLYLNEHKNTKNMTYECYTFGAPSGKHINQEEINSGYEIATQRVERKCQQSKIFLRWLESLTDMVGLKEIAGKMLNKYFSVETMGKSVGKTIETPLRTIKNIIFNTKKKNYDQDERLFAFNNPRDIVPIMSKIIYKGTEDIKLNEEKTIGLLNKLPCISSHSLENYWNSLQKTKLEQVIEDYFNKVQNNIRQKNSFAI